MSVGYFTANDVASKKLMITNDSSPGQPSQEVLNPNQDWGDDRPPAVILQGVHKRYGDRLVVNNLSFTLRQGEMFGLLGPNGAGKSTTIRMITTLTQPTQGQIRVAGWDTQDRAAVRSRIGVVLQQTSVDGDLTVWENLELHGRLHHIPRRERQGRIDRWLSMSNWPIVARIWSKRSRAA